MQRLGVQSHGKRIDSRLTRILQQCGRELLLLEASDWPFMISTGNTPDHARKRATLHYDNFQRVRHMAEQYVEGKTVTEEDWHFLEELECQDALFSELDPNVFWKKQPSALSVQQSAKSLRH
jgi:1,4-alpha-glucan branching enzyme